MRYLTRHPLSAPWYSFRPPRLSGTHLAQMLLTKTRFPSLNSFQPPSGNSPSPAGDLWRRQLPHLPISTEWSSYQLWEHSRYNAYHRRDGHEPKGGIDCLALLSPFIHHQLPIAQIPPPPLHSGGPLITMISGEYAPTTYFSCHFYTYSVSHSAGER